MDSVRVKYIYDPNSRIYLGVSIDPSGDVGAVDFAPPHPAGVGKIWRLNDAGDAWVETDYLEGVQVYSTTDGTAMTLTDKDVSVPDGYTALARPTPAHDWSGSKWMLNKTKQAVIDAAAQAQVMTQAVDAVKHALQAHIDSVAVGLGFSGGNAVMLYAGFANAFQSLAQAFGAWEAGIWAQANQYMAQVKAGEAPMLTPEQAVERIPKFEFAGV